MSPRVLLTKLHDKLKLADLASEERQELGMYQARVVLVVLAAELALKFLWEKVQEDKAQTPPLIREVNHAYPILVRRLEPVPPVQTP